MENLPEQKLVTIFTSNYPIECYIIKGRLESDGINCFIFDENIISVDPFKSIAVGGVKLKVSQDQVEKAKTIIDLVEKNLLIDEYGEYDKEEALKKEFERQNIILNLKKTIQGNPEILNNKDKLLKLLDSDLFSNEEKKMIIKKVSKFHKKSLRKFEFNWKQFWYELFDFERNFFQYLHPNNDQFYIEKGIVDNYSPELKNDLNEKPQCPRCKSQNIKFDYAIDNKPDILYLVLSIIARAPFFPFRKKYHCFECGYNFNKTN